MKRSQLHARALQASRGSDWVEQAWRLARGSAVLAPRPLLQHRRWTTLQGPAAIHKYSSPFFVKDLRRAAEVVGHHLRGWGVNGWCLQGPFFFFHLTEAGRSFGQEGGFMVGEISREFRKQKPYWVPKRIDEAEDCESFGHCFQWNSTWHFHSKCQKGLGLLFSC